MTKSLFELDQQAGNLDAKIVSGLDRIATIYKSLYWEVSKKHALSPIQIQFLIFIKNHESRYNNVSYLAREFCMTKATVSEAVKMLVKKELLIKEASDQDKRSYQLMLGANANSILDELESCLDPVLSVVRKLPRDKKDEIFDFIRIVIEEMWKAGQIDVQRHCPGCRHFLKNEEAAYCKLLQKKLPLEEYRLDCPEFELADW